jgi:hypothetical protein
MCYVRISAQRYSTDEQPSVNFSDACFEFQSFTRKTHCKDKGGGNIPRHSKQRSLVEKQGNQKTSTKSETPQLILYEICTFLTSVSDRVNSQEIGVFIAQVGDGGGLFY